MIGKELALLPGIGKAEKMYIRLFGVPICGLRIRLRRILPFLTGRPATVLDAGCGRGVFSFQLAMRFPNAQVTAVDIDERQLEKNRLIAQAAGLNNLSFQCADVGLLPYRHQFDLVLSVDNLEHIEDDQGAIQGLARALEPGGRLILHVPGVERRWLFFRFRTNFDVPGHYRPGYRLATIKAMVSSAGLTVQQACYTFGWLETVANNFSYLITRAEAKNKIVYALCFPLLNLIAWLGRHSRPAKGAGILIIADKKG